MTTKSIIDVEIDRGGNFKRFAELFDKYTAALAKTPNAWKAVGKEQAAMATQFERMAAALMAQGQVVRETKDEDEKRLKRLSTSEKLWTSISKSAGSVARYVADVTPSLLKWGSLLVGGLVGGSLWGINRMASGVSDSRRSAMGLGLSIGEQKSFNINFERLMDPNFLNQVAEMRMDPSKSTPLYTLGVGTGKSTEDTATAMVKAMYNLAHSTPENMLGTLDARTGMNAGFEQWSRLFRMKPEELNQLIAGNKSGIGAMEPGEKDAKAWANFITQIHTAGAMIETIFVKGLVPLAGPLKELSSSIVKTFATAMEKDGVISQGIENLAKWIEGFSVSLAGDKMQSAIATFMSSVGELADIIHAVAHPGETAANAYTKFVDRGQIENYQAYFRDQSKIAGLPENLGDTLWALESSRSTQGLMVNPKSGALGPFGLMPKTAKDLGVDPTTDISAAGAGAIRYFSQLMKEFHGDLANAFAAYNWGPGNMEHYLHGDIDPKTHKRYAMPSETLQYVGKGTQMLGLPGVMLNINVIGPPGSNPIVTGSAIAAGP